MIAALLSGAGLSLSSGLNAYLPLLILALADRSSIYVDLTGRWSAMSSPWVIFALLIVLPLELVGDKIPRFDHFNDLAHSAIRPAAGALCMAAMASQEGGYSPLLAFVLGLALAAGVHIVKARARPAITRATAGIGNPIQSMAEDAVAIVVSAVAVVIPWVLLVIAPLAGALLWRLARSLRTSSGRLNFLYRNRR